MIFRHVVEKASSVACRKCVTRIMKGGQSLSLHWIADKFQSSLSTDKLRFQYTLTFKISVAKEAESGERDVVPFGLLALKRVFESFPLQLVPEGIVLRNGVAEEVVVVFAVRRRHHRRRVGRRQDRGSGRHRI